MKDRRGSAHAQGYGAAWRRLRKKHLAKEPLCRKCSGMGKVVAGFAVDHVIPHRGNPALLFDENNLQTLCEPHHNSVKQREDKRGTVIGADADGVPIDPRHLWNK